MDDIYETIRQVREHLVYESSRPMIYHYASLLHCWMCETEPSQARIVSDGNIYSHFCLNCLRILRDTDDFREALVIGVLLEGWEL